MLNSYEQTLLDGWEEVHKRGELTLWILLALKDGPKHMGHIKQFIADATNDVLSADDKSIYRALRRYADADMLEHKNQPGKNGPDLKVYNLTDTGAKVLRAFLDRNISTFYKPEFKNLIKA